jgi:hypothetical protein
VVIACSSQIGCGDNSNPDDDGVVVVVAVVVVVVLLPSTGEACTGIVIMLDEKIIASVNIVAVVADAVTW